MPTAGKPREQSRPIEVLGVAKALDGIRDGVAPAVLEEVRVQYGVWLGQERLQGRLELSEDNLSVLTERAAQIASQVAATQSRNKAATAVGETWQLAINRTATAEQYGGTTMRVAGTCAYCGAPIVMAKMTTACVRRGRHITTASFRVRDALRLAPARRPSKPCGGDRRRRRASAAGYGLAARCARFACARARRSGSRGCVGRRSRA